MKSIRGFVRLASIASFCVVTLNFSSAQTFKTLVTFNGANGANPGYGSLIQGTNGSLVGTTIYGGSYYGQNYGCPNPYGCGTVFSMGTDGRLLAGESFAPNGGPGLPNAGVIQASDGNFYGTTIDGGSQDCGTLFKISAKGVVTTLYNFQCAADGGYPQGSLVQATNGYLYGTNSGGAYGYGTIFQVSTSGAFTTLYSFCPSGTDNGCPDGAIPVANLIQGSDGNLYGTTAKGNYMMGTVFKMTPSGKLTTIYSFCSEGHCYDGNTPESGLIEGADGAFYGTAIGGGETGNGVVYRVTSSGGYSVLYSFSGSDGSQPFGSLVYGSDGNLYGTTSAGSTNSAGTAFRLTASGTLTTLHAFCSQQYCSDGQTPYGGLTQHTDGTLYGTTNTGGNTTCETITAGCGTIFQISAGLPPFVEASPNLGRAGAAVTILGTGLTGVQSVTFNGTAAQFTVLSSTAVKAIVPIGATTGKIQVTLASQTLSSVLNFTVQ